MIVLIRHLLKAFFILFLFINNAMGGNYYFIEHKDDHMHIIAYFHKHYSLNELYIPDKIWGTNYSKQIVNIKITKGEYKKHNSTDLFDTTLHTKIEYDLVNIPQNEYLKLFPDNYHHYIKKNKFFLIGMGAFIRPNDTNMNNEAILKIDSNLDIINNIDGHFFDTSFVKVNFKSLPDIIILGGAKIITSDKIGSNLFTLNIENSSSEKIVQSIQNSFRKFNSFWRKHGFSLENKVIVIIGPPKRINRNAYTANVKNNTILAFIIPEKNEDIDLNNLFEHELHHFIFGCNAICGPKWFTEGFSDYYKDKINALDTNDIKAFVDKYNKILSFYYKSKYSHLTDSEIEKLFFENKEIERLPYNKGYLIAGQIDTITNLDMIIKSLISSCKNQGKCKFNLNSLIKNSNGLSELDKIKLQRLIQEFEKLKAEDFASFKPHIN